MNTAQNNETPMSSESVQEEIRRLEGIARDADDRLQRLRAQNDADEARPSKAATGGENSALRVTKKVVGIALGVGVTALAGVFIYSRLQSAGVDPDAVVDAVVG